MQLIVQWRFALKCPLHVIVLALVWRDVFPVTASEVLSSACLWREELIVFSEGEAAKCETVPVFSKNCFWKAKLSLKWPFLLV